MDGAGVQKTPLLRSRVNLYYIVLMLIFISTTITKSTLLPDPVFVANKIAVSMIIMIIKRYCKFILLM